MDYFKKYKKKYYKKALYYSKILLLLLIILLIVYFIEKYIYKIIYIIIYILTEKIFFFLKGIFFSTKIKSIIITIYLNIIFARLIILSIIFLQGGLLKKVLSYEQFQFFINLLNNFLESIYENLNSNHIDDAKHFMSKINLFKMSYFKNKSKNISFVVKNYTFEEELNKMFEKYDKYLINNNLEAKNDFIESIKDFSNQLIKYNNFSIFEILFKFKYSQSLMIMEEYMKNSFETHIVEKVNIGNDFYIYILSPKVEKNDNKILSIYCNQNALCCEYYALGHDNIDFYLYYLNSTIILWNYSGYGLRKGITTFAKIDKDVNILSQYIKNNFNNFKIIIHGCSIGGYSSIKLMQKLNDLKNVVLISDRTFSDIDKIALTLGYGKILSIFYNILFPKFLFHSNNTDNYISIPSDKKLICFDANDEIIFYNPASLVYNLTHKYYNDIVKPKIKKYKEYKILIENPEYLIKELKELVSKDFDNNGKIFIQHLYKYIDSIEEFFMFFIVFGYPFNRFKEISCNTEKFNKSYLQIPKIIMNFANKNRIWFSDKLLNLIQIFNFLYIKFNLKTEINDNDIIKLNYDNNALFQFNDSFAIELHKYFGFVHRITCGHNGKLKFNDLNVIKEFLGKNNIV